MWNALGLDSRSGRRGEDCHGWTDLKWLAFHWKAPTPCLLPLGRGATRNRRRSDRAGKRTLRSAAKSQSRPIAGIGCLPLAPARPRVPRTRVVAKVYISDTSGEGRQILMQLQYVSHSDSPRASGMRLSGPGEVRLFNGQHFTSFVQVAPRHGVKFDGHPQCSRRR